MNAEASTLYVARAKDRCIAHDVLETVRMEQRQEERLRLVVNAYKQGIAIPVIALIAAISEEEVAKMLRVQGLA